MGDPVILCKVVWWDCRRQNWKICAQARHHDDLRVSRAESAICSGSITGEPERLVTLCNNRLSAPASMWHLPGTLTVQTAGARTTLPLIMRGCSDNPAANTSQS